MNTQTLETPDYVIAANELRSYFDSLDIKTEISDPQPYLNDEGGYPVIAYSVLFKKEGKLATGQDDVPFFVYKLGTGYVKPKEHRLRSIENRFNANEESLLRTWQSNPHANFKDKKLWASVAVKLAKIQKVSPKPEQVLAAICAEALEARSSNFVDWAVMFGYDTDSRKAERIYNTCLDEYWKVKTILDDKQIERFARFNQEL